jgi:hypothetical protein
MNRARLLASAIAGALALFAAATGSAEVCPLVGEDGRATEEALEALLSPGEFADRRFEYVSAKDEAAFVVDSSLGEAKPFARLIPERVPWPKVAGMALSVNDGELRLRPTGADVRDEDLDAGFTVRWVLAPVGQRFSPVPVFEMRVAGAQVISAAGGRELLRWSEPPAPARCVEGESGARPRCRMQGLGREARSIALSPDGNRLAVAFGGLKPRLEVYDAAGEPRLEWRSRFPAEAGGVVETAFSFDGRWVVALTGNGAMHRYDARTGGMHMSIPSSGRSARSVPPGRTMAVAGDAGEITLWYLSDGTIYWRLPPRRLRGPVDRLASSADGLRLATLEYDGDRALARVWETRRREMLAEVAVDASAVRDIALDANGARLFVSHAEAGLQVVDVGPRGATPKPTGDAGAGCRGRVQWIAGLGVLGCAVPRGVIHVDRAGALVEELETGVEAGDWIVTAASGGRRIAAIGEGNLLLWWRGDETSREGDE